MSVSSSVKRKRHDGIGSTAGNAKRPRSVGKSLSGIDEISPRSSSKKGRSSVSEIVNSDEIVVVERVISLRSKEIITPLIKKVRRQQIMEHHSGADSDEEAWEGMDVESSSTSGSEMSTPAKRLYANASKSAGSVQVIGRRSLPASATSRSSQQLGASASAGDIAIEVGTSSALARAGRRSSHSGAASSSSSSSGAVGTGNRRSQQQQQQQHKEQHVEAGPATAAAAASKVPEVETHTGLLSSSSRNSSSSRGGSRTSKSSVSVTAAAAPAARPAATRVRAPALLTPAPMSAPAPAPLPALFPLPPLGQQQAPAAQAGTGTGLGVEERGPGERALAGGETGVIPAGNSDGEQRGLLWLLRGGRWAVLALLVSAAVAYALTSVAWLPAEQWRAAPQRQPSRKNTGPAFTPEQSDTAPGPLPGSPDVVALLKQAAEQAASNQRAFELAQAAVEALQARAAVASSSLSAAEDQQRVQLGEAQQRLDEVLRAAEDLGQQVAGFNSSRAAQVAETAQRLSHQSGEDSVTAASLFEAVGGDLVAGIAATKAKSEETLCALRAEVRALALRAEALAARRTALSLALSGAAAASSSSSSFSAVSELSAAAETGGGGASLPAERLALELLLEQLQDAQTVLEEQLAEETVELVSSQVQQLRGALEETEGRVADSEARAEREGRQYADQQAAAVQEAEAAALNASKATQQAVVDASVAAAVEVADSAAAVPITIGKRSPSPLSPAAPFRDVHLSAEDSEAFISRASEEVLGHAIERVRADSTALFDADVAARTSAIQQASESALAQQLQREREGQLEALLHRTGYSRTNRGLSLAPDEEEQEDGEAGEGDEKDEAGAEDEEVVRDLLAAMHDFAVGVRGGRAVHHRVLCRAGGGQRLTSPPYSHSEGAAAGVTSALLSPLKAVWDSLVPSSQSQARSADQQRPGPHSHKPAAQSGRRVSVAPVTLLVAHTRPSAESFYAMAHTTGASQGAARPHRRPLSATAVGFDYAASVQEALAQVTVVLLAPVNVTVLKVIHATAGPDPSLPPCAPLRVRLLGWTEDPATVRRLAGAVLDLGELELGESVPGAAYRYQDGDAGAEGRGFVWERAVLSPSLARGLPLPPLRALTLQVLENAGERAFSCLHRLQVIGTMQG